MAKTLQDIMKEREVKPLTNVNGTPVVTFAEQRDAATDALRYNVDIGIREYNPDGTLKKTLYHNAAINEGTFFDNRYRVVGDVMQLVTAQTTEGFRAIREQNSGIIFTKHLGAYEFIREDGKLKYKGMTLVSDSDFVSSFTNKLSKENMKLILPLSPADASVAETSLPI